MPGRIQLSRLLRSNNTLHYKRRLNVQTFSLPKRSLSSQADQVAFSKDTDLVALQNRSFHYQDFLSKQPAILLQRAFESYLPQRNGSINNSNDVDIFHLGYQHVYCRPDLRQQDLCADGTDTKFLPGPEEIWKYRLWAGGSVAYESENPVRLGNHVGILLHEQVSNTRIVEDHGTPSRVFVTIKRSFGLISGQDATYSNSSWTPNPGRDHTDVQSPFATETENICFLRDPPKSLQDTRKISPPQNPGFTHTMTPTRSLLFQFSALTYNAHNIHLDRELARNTYGARDLVVHGPLTQVLMLEFLRHTLQNVVGSSISRVVLRRIEYTNLRPLFVNEPLTLCCQPAAKDSSGHLADVKKWQVWIQTGDGENLSMAVKAAVDVGILPET